MKFSDRQLQIYESKMVGLLKIRKVLATYCMWKTITHVAHQHST